MYRGSIPMKLSLVLPPYPGEQWALARQIGVTHAVATLPDPDDDEHPWDMGPLGRMHRRLREAGFAVDAVEALPPLDRARLGLPGGDDEIEHVCTLIRNMGRLGIQVLCWNWMAGFGWLRTETAHRTRGGALVTGYDHGRVQGPAPIEAGRADEGRLWDTLREFMQRVVPVAEAAGVKLALHPDDPPLPQIRGVARIIRSPAALERATELVPSPGNGITYCQGTFAAMGADVPATIRFFGEGSKIHFVHLRDIRGTAEHFEETFPDDGQTDMLAAMRAYFDIGFDGPMRSDHVPTMATETNDRPGYGMLGHLFTTGYMKGLMEAAAAERVERGG